MYTISGVDVGSTSTGFIETIRTTYMKRYPELAEFYIKYSFSTVEVHTNFIEWLIQEWMKIHKIIYMNVLVSI